MTLISLSLSLSVSLSLCVSLSLSVSLWAEKRAILSGLVLVSKLVDPTPFHVCPCQAPYVGVSSSTRHLSIVPKPFAGHLCAAAAARKHVPLARSSSTARSSRSFLSRRNFLSFCVLFRGDWQQATQVRNGWVRYGGLEREPAYLLLPPPLLIDDPLIL